MRFSWLRFLFKLMKAETFFCFSLMPELVMAVSVTRSCPGTEESPPFFWTALGDFVLNVADDVIDPLSPFLAPDDKPIFIPPSVKTSFGDIPSVAPLS